MFRPPSPPNPDANVVAPPLSTPPRHHVNAVVIRPIHRHRPLLHLTLHHPTYHAFVSDLDLPLHLLTRHQPFHLSPPTLPHQTLSPSTPKLSSLVAFSAALPAQ
ncbi:hypothetical protein HDU96_003317, partial [Phlyctochytrium bullatum]